MPRFNLGNSLPGDSIQGQAGSSTSTRTPRQLRNRSVARSITSKRSVKFHEVVDCLEQDQHYQERIQFEKEGTLFPPLEHREDMNYLSRKNGNFSMILLHREHSKERDSRQVLWHNKCLPNHMSLQYV